MHPKGTCSASLHCVGIAPYGTTAGNLCVGARLCPARFPRRRALDNPAGMGIIINEGDAATSGQPLIANNGFTKETVTGQGGGFCFSAS